MDVARLQVLIDTNVPAATKELEKMGTTVDKTASGPGKNLTNMTGDVNKGLSGMVEQMTGVSLGSIGLAGGVMMAAGALKEMAELAMKAEVNDARLGAVIKATGETAGMNVEQIKRMAGELANMSGVDDDLIQSASTVLLTFRDIGQDVFPEAMTAAMDMSAVMGQDLQSSVTQLGKALNDPIEGLTALKRVGVAFTDEQKKMITGLVNAGDKMGAQKIILAELNTEFGGTAKAMGSTLQGNMNKFNNNVENAKENLGAMLLKLIPINGALETLNDLAAWPEKVNGALEDHEQTMRTVAKDYQEYVTEMDRAAKVAGFLYNANGDLVKVYTVEGIEIEEVIKKNARLSEVQLNVVKGLYNIQDEGTRFVNAAKNWKLATDGVARSQEELQLFMSGSLGKEFEAFGEKSDKLKKKQEELTLEIGKLSTLKYLTPAQEGELAVLYGKQSDLWTQIEKLNKQEHLTPEQKTQLGDLKKRYDGIVQQVMNLTNGSYLTPAQKEQLGELNKELAATKLEMEAVAKTHEETTLKILYGFLQQKLAADGVIDENDLDILTRVQEKWGLVDEKTFAAWTNIGKIVDEGARAKKSAEEIAAALDAIPKEININVSFNGIVPNPQNGEQSGAYTTINPKEEVVKKGVPKLANGADFIVPPGYPNDSYPIRVQSGERVVVTPAGEVGKSSGGDIIIQIANVTLADSMDIYATADRLGAEIARRGRR